jgi:hypothetical protein
MNQLSFELGDISPTKYFAGVAVLLAVLFSLVANNDDVPYFVNLLQWLFQSIVPMALMVLSYKFCLSSALFNRLNPWLSLLVAGCAGALLFVPFALLLDLWLGHDPVPTSAAAILFALADEAAGVMPPVVLCWLAINAPWMLGFKVVKTSQQSAAAEEVVVVQAGATADIRQLLDMLPAAKRGDILYLKSELHYLLVVTTAGQSLILFNLRDAITACSGLDGIQPHRSYWVQKSAVRAFRKEGREGVLVLSNDTEIPVSRSKVSEVSQLFI